MKAGELNKNLEVSSIIIDHGYDEDDYEIPAYYEVCFHYFGYEYIATYSVNDIRDADLCGLSPTFLIGESELQDTMESYFDGDKHEKEKGKLLALIERTWKEEVPGSPYNYIGDKN